MIDISFDWSSRMPRFPKFNYSLIQCQAFSHILLRLEVKFIKIQGCWCFNNFVPFNDIGFNYISYFSSANFIFIFISPVVNLYNLFIVFIFRLQPSEYKEHMCRNWFKYSWMGQTHLFNVNTLKGTSLKKLRTLDNTHILSFWCGITCLLTLFKIWSGSDKYSPPQIKM